MNKMEMFSKRLNYFYGGPAYHVYFLATIATVANLYLLVVFIDYIIIKKSLGQRQNRRTNFYDNKE